MPARASSHLPVHPDSRTLLLASSSAYRRALLERFGWAFSVQSPDIDEGPLAHESPYDLVSRLALAKARALMQEHPHALVIGSDQVAVLDGQPLGKPGTEQRAVAQLEAASGRTVQFLTGLCLLDTASGAYELAVVPTQVRFRTLDALTIRNYVRREQALDCAGSFKCEGLGIALFEAISSTDPTALIGLPLIALQAMLARAGFDVLADSP